MKTQLFILFLSVSFIACGGKEKKPIVDSTGAASFEKSLIDGIDIDAKLASKETLLVDMGELVPLNNIATSLGIDPKISKKQK